MKIDSIAEYPTLVSFENNSFLHNSQISSKLNQTSGQSILFKKRDFRKLGVNTSLFVGVGFVGMGVSWFLPRNILKWDKKKVEKKGLLKVWADNIERGPIIDHDKWYFNYVIHPYTGAIYYMAARSCGFNWYESFGYSILMSTFFWEYGFEGLTQVPSIQDLICTPTTGIIIGEFFFYAKKEILKYNKRVLNSNIFLFTTLFLLDPANTVADFLGYKLKINSTITLANFSSILYNQKPSLGFKLTASF